MKYLLILFLFLVGCHVPSKVVMEGSGGRAAYNLEVQKTNGEEMLLNLVRLRYFDTPFFVNVSSVTTTFTFSNKAAATLAIPGFITNKNSLSLGGESQWSNQPTIQYSPLQGQEFASQILNPIKVSTLKQVVYSGWEIDRVFQLAVQDLKDLRNITKDGMIYPSEADKYLNFYKVINLLRELQKRGLLQIGFTEISKKDDLSLKTLQLAFPSKETLGKQIGKLLDEKDPINGKYVLNFVDGFDEKGQVGILPRSIISCMRSLSRGVTVPKEDVKKKTVIDFPEDFLENKEYEKIIRGLLKVHNSPFKPKNAYVAIKYRDHWFYIKDNDINSKKTFMLLLELYNLQAGMAKETGPVLTLPLGVG